MLLDLHRSCKSVLKPGHIRYFRLKMKMIGFFALVLVALSASGRVILKKAGETVVLECGVEAATSLRWTRESDVLFSLKPGRIPSYGNSPIQSRCSLKQSNLEIQKLSLADAGKFKCRIGEKEQEMRLVVFSVYASPSHELLLASQATLHCVVNPDVPVQWKGPEGGIRSQSAEVRLDLVVQQDAGTWMCTFSYGSDTHTERLELTVKEPRPTTLPPPSRTTGNAMPGEEESQPDDPSSPAKIELLGIALWMWAAIGVGGLVVALLLAIVIVCVCRRVRRRRRLARKMKNGHQLRSPVQYCQCDGPTAAAKPQQRRQRAKPAPPPLQGLLVE